MLNQDPVSDSRNGFLKLERVEQEGLNYMANASC